MHQLSNDQKMCVSMMYGDFGLIGEAGVVDQRLEEQRMWCCPQCLRVFKKGRSGDVHRDVCREAIPGLPVYVDTVRSISIHMISVETDGEFVSRLCALAAAEMPSKMETVQLKNYAFYICAVGKNFLRKNGMACADRQESPAAMTVAAFFSRDRTRKDHNLSAIVTYRPFRSLGLGFLLVGFSYFLSTERIRSRRVLRALRDVEVFHPGPEYPLSSAGEKLFHGYWNYVVSKTLISELIHQGRATLRVKDISRLTGVDYFVVIETFKCLAVKSDMDAAWMHEKNIRREAEIFRGPFDGDRDVLLMKGSRRVICHVHVPMEIVSQVDLVAIPIDTANVIQDNLSNA